MSSHRHRKRSSSLEHHRNRLNPKLVPFSFEAVINLTSSSTIQGFDYKDICPLITTKRFISFRRLSALFPAIPPGKTATVQYMLFDDSTQQFFFIKRGIQLSSEYPKRISLRIPSKYARYHQHDSGIPAFALSIHSTDVDTAWRVQFNTNYDVAF
jgi:hypothetical protein